MTGDFFDDVEPMVWSIYCATIFERQNELARSGNAGPYDFDFVVGVEWSDTLRESGTDALCRLIGILMDAQAVELNYPMPGTSFLADVAVFVGRIIQPGEVFVGPAPLTGENVALRLLRQAGYHEVTLGREKWKGAISRAANESESQRTQTLYEALRKCFAYDPSVAPLDNFSDATHWARRYFDKLNQA